MGISSRGLLKGVKSEEATLDDEEMIASVVWHVSEKGEKRVLFSEMGGSLEVRVRLWLLGLILRARRGVREGRWGGCILRGL